MNDTTLALVAAILAPVKTMFDYATTTKNEKLKKYANEMLYTLSNIVLVEANNITDYGKPKLTSLEIDFLATKQKIPAIKSVRERTGMGLAEGKKYVEDWMEENWGYRYFPENKF